MLFAQEDARPLLDFTLKPLLEEHGFPLAIMGILVVFAALTLLAVFIALLPRLLAGRATVASADLALSEVGGAGDGEISDETLAIIAAAVAAVMDKPHRVTYVRGLVPGNLEWSIEGRFQHHHSHQVGPQRWS